LEGRLANGKDVNMVDGDLNSALDYASGNGDLAIVKYLIENSADINIKAKSGKTALAWATENGHTEIVEYLESL